MLHYINYYWILILQFRHWSNWCINCFAE